MASEQKKRKANRPARSRRMLAWWTGAGLAVLFAGLLVIQYAGGPNQHATGAGMIGQMAPAISLASTQGPVHLTNLRGHNVVLYFYEGNS